MDFAAMFIKLITKNGLVAAFIIIGITTWIAYKIGGLTKGRIHGSAIAIFFGLILAYIGGVVGGGHKGLASIPMFAGVGVMGGAMFRDFAIVSTAFGADLREIKKVGLVGVLSLIFGLLTSWVAGVGVAYAMGYTDSVSLVTIGAGVATFVVGPVTGASLGASSEVIAISIAAGVVKSVLVMILTPFVAKFVGLDNPQSAMIYGGLMGTTSGTACRDGSSRSQTGSVCGNDSYILYRFRLSGISVNSVFCNKSYFWLSNDPGRKQVQRCMITKLKN
jgi:malonate transporter, madM subunit